MEDAMVTGRMSREKKEKGNAVLERCGLNASQVVNMLYDRLIEEQGVGFLRSEKAAPTKAQRAEARAFLDALVVPRSSRFDEMTRGEIKSERLAARGLM